MTHQVISEMLGYGGEPMRILSFRYVPSKSNRKSHRIDFTDFDLIRKEYRKEWVKWRTLQPTNKSSAANVDPVLEQAERFALHCERTRGVDPINQKRLATIHFHRRLATSGLKGTTCPSKITCRVMPAEETTDTRDGS